MAYTIENNYTGNATTTLFSFTFPYLDTTDIKVSLDQVDQTLTTHYTLASPTQISFVSAPGSGVAVRIYRDTDISNLQSEFFSGSAIRAQDLNNDFNQTLYVSQETQDKVDGHWNDTTDTIDSTEAFADVNTKIMTAAAIDDRINANIAAQPLANGKIFAGNGSGVAAAVTPSGDVTMANTGVFTIASTAVETSMIANDAINGTKLADNSVDSEHYVDGSIDTVHLGAGVVTEAKLGAGSVTTTKIPDSAITNAKIADDQIDSEHYVDGSIDSAHLGAGVVIEAKLGTGSVTTTKIPDSAITTAKINNDAVTAAKIPDDAIDASHIADNAISQDMLQDNSVNTDNYVDNSILNEHINTGAAIGLNKLATGALPTGITVDSANYTATSIDAAHISTNAVITAKINGDAVTGDKIADDQIDSEHYVDGSIDTAHLANDAVDGTKIADDSIDSEHYVNGSIDADHIASDAVTFVKIGCEQTTISDSDTHIPTSGAVVDYVAGAISPLGGFEAIATEDVFPTTVPAAGVIVSIADATEISVNSSGVATNCRTDGNGSDNVTINGFPSILRGGVGDNADPYILPASSGLLVVSTGASHTYNYHRLIATTEDIKLLSDTVESFKARYRIASSAPGSDNNDGDLYYNTSTDTLFVYDGSQWEAGVSTTPNDDTVTGAKLDISLVAGDVIFASGTDTLARLAKPGSNKFLRNTSGGTLSWETVTSTPEGTAVLSTGESGGTKFLREDGDGTCSWQTAGGTISALNSATENELCTVGSTTTELDAETNLTFQDTTSTGLICGKQITGRGFECPAEITDDWTIAGTNNAMFPGPMTIASTKTVTVPTGRTLTIV